MREFTGFLKGVNLGGWLSQCRLEKEHLESFITEADLKCIKEFGLDHVRLPIDYPLIEAEDGTPLWDGYTYIDRCAEWCEKYGLGLILDLHKTAGHDFSQAGGRTAFFENDDLQERFFSLWERMAKRYGSCEWIAFDLLNEVVDPAVSESWNKIALRTIARIRQYAPQNWILVGGINYNHIFSVKNLLLPPDERIVYSFHFYEPFLFTHQGAHWEKNMPSDFRIGYPLTVEEYKTCADQNCNGLYTGFLDRMQAVMPRGCESVPEMLAEAFAEAVRIAEERDVPLYCGEYGVINLADIPYALAWHEDMHALFSRFGMGRALWSYRRMDFGLVDSHYEDALSQLLPLL
ncbi:MAG: cellulase family glycosylhydrolase [Lachnospiraceae bacterium]|nr:cellulase family glycosylhydrolase [Lachnospiraceae bacterium]